MTVSRTEHLTQRTIDRAGPMVDDDYVIYDDDPTGLYLRVQPSGVKSLALRFSYGGKSRYLTIGRANVIPLDKAREIAKQHLREVAAGIDPSRKGKSARSVQAVYERWMRKHVETKLKPKTQKDYKMIFENHILPRIGHRDANRLTTLEVQDLHNSLWETPYMANRVLATLSAMFQWAGKVGLRDPQLVNPVSGIQRFKEKHRERYLTNEEINTVMEGLRVYGSQDFADVIRLLLLTGARKSEIERLEWGWIDWERKLVRLPDSKTGGRSLHLSQPAYELLVRRRPLYQTEQYVFPSSLDKGHYRSTGVEWQRFRKSIGLPSVRLHDLRHTFASLAANNGVPLNVVGGLLGHTQVATTKRYAHLYDDTLQEAVNNVSRQIDTD